MMPSPNYHPIRVTVTTTTALKDSTNQNNNNVVAKYKSASSNFVHKQKEKQKQKLYQNQPSPLPLLPAQKQTRKLIDDEIGGNGNSFTCFEELSLSVPLFPLTGGGEYGNNSNNNTTISRKIEGIIPKQKEKQRQQQKLLYQQPPPPPLPPAQKQTQQLIDDENNGIGTHNPSFTCFEELSLAILPLILLTEEDKDDGINSNSNNNAIINRKNEGMNSSIGDEEQDQDQDGCGDVSRRPLPLQSSSIDEDYNDRNKNNNTINRKSEGLNSAVGDEGEGGDDCGDTSHTIKNFGIRSLLVKDLQKQLHHSMPSSPPPTSIEAVVKKPPPAPKLVHNEMRDLLFEFYLRTDKMPLITFIKMKKRLSNKTAIYRHWKKSGLKNMKKNIVLPISEASIIYDSWCATTRGIGTTNFNGEPPNFGHYLNPGEVISDLDVLCGCGGDHHVGNKKYQKFVNEMKAAYQKLNGNKRKTIFIHDIVMYYINECGGRFIDVTRQGRYYVVNVKKSRKKTSQALRQTTEPKRLDIDQRKDSDVIAGPPPPQKEVFPSASASASAESESSYHYNIQEKGKYDNSGSVSLTATTSTILDAVNNVSFLFEKRPPIERDSSSPEMKRSRRNKRNVFFDDGHEVQDVSAGSKILPTRIVYTTTQSHSFVNNCTNSKRRNSSSKYVVEV